LTCFDQSNDPCNGKFISSLLVELLFFFRMANSGKSSLDMGHTKAILPFQLHKKCLQIIPGLASVLQQVM
jgi:hypothetical protein